MFVVEALPETNSDDEGDEDEEVNSLDSLTYSLTSLLCSRRTQMWWRGMTEKKTLEEWIQ